VKEKLETFDEFVLKEKILIAVLGEEFEEYSKAIENPNSKPNFSDWCE
jgi:hypothetical protein